MSWRGFDDRLPFRAELPRHTRPRVFKPTTLPRIRRRLKRRDRLKQTDNVLFVPLEHLQQPRGLLGLREDQPGVNVGAHERQQRWGLHPFFPRLRSRWRRVVDQPIFLGSIAPEPRVGRHIFGAHIPVLLQRFQDRVEVFGVDPPTRPNPPRQPRRNLIAMPRAFKHHSEHHRL